MASISDKDFLRLTEAIEWSQLQFTKPREDRIEIIRQLVGSHYADGGADKNIPVPMLKLAHDIYVRSLAARAPRALLSTLVPGMEPVAADLELAVNQIPPEIKLGRTLRRLVSEALISSAGVVKIGLHTVGEVLGYDYGEPFVDLVTIDDYFCDMSAKREEHMQFEGNDYWAIYEKVMKSDWFSNKEGLSADDEVSTGERGEERAEGISVDSTASTYKKRIHFRDVWLPDEGKIVTYAVTSKRRVNEMEWGGPETGPYLKLSYFDVPGNILSLPQAAVWRDLHDLYNAIFRKLGVQADSEKSVLGFANEDPEGVENFKAALDGEGIRYSGVEPKILKAGGVSQTTLAFSMHCKELFSYFGGNLDSLGGLAAMTETVGQDKLLSEASGALLRDMASKTIEISREIFRSLAWYEWHNPLKERTLQKSIPGLRGESIPVRWGPESRQGNFNVFDLDIDVYSLLDDSPNQKLQRFGYIMQNYIVPLMPEIQRQGGSLDVQDILKLVAKLADFRELDDLIAFADENPLAPDNGSAPGQGGATQTNEGGAGPGAAQQGNSDMLRLLMGNQSQGE